MIFETIIQKFSEIFSALIILFIGVVVARIAQKVTLRSMKELEVSYLFSKATKFRGSLDNFVSKFVMYIVYLVTIVIILIYLGIYQIFLLIILGLIVFLSVLGISIYFVSIFPNLWARFKLRKMGLEKGKNLYVENINGEIIGVTIQHVKVKSSSNKEIYHLPFNYLLKKKFKLK